LHWCLGICPKGAAILKRGREEKRVTVDRTKKGNWAPGREERGFFGLNKEKKGGKKNRLQAEEGGAYFTIC